MNNIMNNVQRVIRNSLLREEHKKLLLNLLPNQSARYFSKTTASDGSGQTKKADKHAEAAAAEAAKRPRPKKFRIYRYDPSGKNKKPYMQTYTVDLNSCGPMVLDALNKIKSDQDTSLVYRKSCREGICGSCGMNIDGINKLACLEKISPKGTTKIYPLPHMYVIKDLVVDFNRFLEQHNRTKPYLIHHNEGIKEGDKQFIQSIKDRDVLVGKCECILCACCSTSCPEYWWHGHSDLPNDFLGPAALLQVYRWIVDSRDAGTAERLQDLRNYFHVYRCHQINNCTSVCPKKLEPGKAIAQLRLFLARFKGKAKSDLKGQLPSDPMKACEKKCEEH